jgi:hypothetical protein
LTAVTFSQSPSVLLPADLAAIAQAILNDPTGATGPGTSMMVGAHSVIPGAFNYMGILTIPGRGFLKVLPGDVLAVDPTTNVGWPILVSANAIANGAWVLT